MFASIPSPPFNTIPIRPIDLHVYGLLIGIGVILAVTITLNRYTDDPDVRQEIERILVRAVIVGFVVIRIHSKGALERNLLLYVEYLTDDLGVPPDEARALEIARRTGMTISYAHKDESWQTGPPPRFFNPNRAWVRQRSPGIWVGSSKGHHFVRIFHGGGELTFIAPRDVRHGKELARMFRAQEYIEVPNIDHNEVLFAGEPAMRYLRFLELAVPAEQ